MTTYEQRVGLADGQPPAWTLSRLVIMAVPDHGRRPAKEASLVAMVRDEPMPSTIDDPAALDALRVILPAGPGGGRLAGIRHGV